MIPAIGAAIAFFTVLLLVAGFDRHTVTHTGLWSAGWYCKGGPAHDGPCAAWPRFWAHPIWWLRCHVR